MPPCPLPSQHPAAMSHTQLVYPAHPHPQYSHKPCPPCAGSTHWLWPQWSVDHGCAATGCCPRSRHGGGGCAPCGRGEAWCMARGCRKGSRQGGMGRFCPLQHVATGWDMSPSACPMPSSKPGSPASCGRWGVQGVQGDRVHSPRVPRGVGAFTAQAGPTTCSRWPRGRARPHACFLYSNLWL